MITFYSIEGFLKSSHQKEELLGSLESALLHKKQTVDEGTYSLVLKEYANQVINHEITSKIYDVFSNQFMKKVDHACDVYEWLQEALTSPDLQINAIENEQNLIGYYGKQVDDYFASHLKEVIAELNSCSSKNELINTGLYSIIQKMFENIPIYYKSFEDEIDERVRADTAKDMFEKINEESSVNRNICIDWTNLQFKLNISKTGSVLLLINPKSKLLKLDIAENFKSLKLNRQDCVERIDFHTLSLKKEVN